MGQTLDTSLKTLGLAVLKTPYKSPQANALLRKADWHCSAGVFGFHHSLQ